MSSSIICVLLMGISASSPLNTAIQCYENLDYPCAETHLTEALASSLSSSDRLKALYYQSLIATAWRDETRVRRIVKNIFTLDPDFRPSNAPAQLKTIFDRYRPKPVPGPAMNLRLDYAYTLMTDDDNDGDWWSVGQGVDGAVGVIFRDRYVLDLSVRWSHHPPQSHRISVNRLTYWGAMLNGGLTQRWNRWRLMAGLGLGGIRFDRDVIGDYRRFKDASATAPFWTVSLNGYIDLSIELVDGFGIGVRWAPMVLVRNHEDQPILSYLLPMTAGVRYGR